MRKFTAQQQQQRRHRKLTKRPVNQVESIFFNTKYDIDRQESIKPKVDVAKGKLTQPSKCPIEGLMNTIAASLLILSNRGFNEYYCRFSSYSVQ